MNKIVERIDELRAQKGWSRDYLAKNAHIARNTVFRWSRFDSVPTLANVDLICKAMGLTREQFFCGMGEKEANSCDKIFLREWFSLSDREKQSIRSAITAFKSMREGESVNV